MRTNQAHAALQLGVPALGHPLQQCRAQLFDISGAGLDVDARAVTDRGRPRRRRQQLVALLHFGCQLVHQIDPGGHQLCAVGGQMPVPNIKRVKGTAVTPKPRAGRGLQ